MTSRVVRENGAFRRIIISCDQMDCDKSLDDHEIGEGGGLGKMGWEYAHVPGSNLHHYCPEHRRSK